MGTTRTVGIEVVKQLTTILSSSSGYNIMAAVHSQNKVHGVKQVDAEDVKIVNLDYARPETLASALNKIDKLFLQTLPVPDRTEITSNLIKEA